MSTPHPDDSWAELYSELGLEPETASPAAAISESSSNESEDNDADDSGEAGEFLESADAMDNDSELDADGETDGEGELAEGELAGEAGDANPKKRRRRRRRRGGKRDDAEGTAEGETATEEGDVAVAVLDEEDGPGPEAAQQLIANWDVPSWGEIVSGLFRPSGNGR